jgi:hypothetical protein
MVVQVSCGIVAVFAADVAQYIAGAAHYQSCLLQLCYIQSAMCKRGSKVAVVLDAPVQWLEFSSPVYEQLYQEHFARAYQSTDFCICIVNFFFGLSWVVRVWRINPW